MITTTHVRLDQAILQVHHWIHQAAESDAELQISISEAEMHAQGLRASTVQAMRALSGGSAIDALVLLWCAGGILPIVEVDANGHAKEPAVAWRGKAMIDYIARVGLDKLYTPQFGISHSNVDDVTQSAQVSEVIARFDPLSLKRIRAEFCLTEQPLSWFNNAAHRPAKWVSDAKVGKNRYDPEKIASGFVEGGKLDQGKANRILKRLLPERSRHLEELYE